MIAAQASKPPQQVLFAGVVVEWPHAREAYLTNLEDLRRVCPKEFFDSKNLWRMYAKAVHYWMGDRGGTNHWVWKSQDKNVQQDQLRQWNFVTLSAGLSWEEELAIGGWMLSEMLVEVPKHTPPPVHM